MSYLDTIGAQNITPKDPGYLATIGATEGVSEVAPSQYIDSVEECGCHVEEAVREQGYLGWFATLAECLEAHPQPRLGMSFKNVTTRSVWLYDGVRWVNTTQGNPFAMIHDEENAGWVRRGIAHSFYYLPKEEGEKQFTFEIEGGGSATISVPITSISEVVFIEWTGETLGYAIHQLDPDVVKNEGGVLKTLSGEEVIDINELLENIEILDQYTGDIDKRLHAEADRAKAAEQTLRDEITAVGDVAVKHEAQTLSTGQKCTARSNIGAVGVSSVTEHGAQLEENGNAIYPTTKATHVQLSNGVDSETMLYATHKKAKSVEDKLNAFFANAEVSGNAVDTLKELQEYITSDAEAAAEMLQRVSENAEAIATLSDDSVQYSAQSKSSSEQTQARRNIGAVGVAPVSGMTLLEHNGQSIYPTTNSSEVRMVDETGTYTGMLNEKLKWLEENSSIGGIMDDEGYLVSNGERVDMRFTRSLLPVGTSIPASANLNTIAYLKIGKYYCSMNAEAKTIKNCPVNVAFSMEVFNPLGTNVDDETTKEYTYRLRVLTQYDTGQQYTQFCRTKGTPGSWVYESWYIIPRATFTLNSSKNDGTAALGSATQGIYLDATGLFKKMSYTLGMSVPSSAVFTDTKVTAVGNHYTPAEDESAVINADEGAVVTGIKRDAAGHVVGVISEVVEGGNCDVGLEDVGTDIEGVEGITSNLLNLIVTVGGEYYYNYEEETEKCINKGLRIWVSGRASGRLCLRLMRNVKRNGSNERSGWRPIDVNSRNGELPTNIDGWYKPLDYVLLPFPTNAQNEYIYNNGLLKDGDGVMIGPHNLVEQLFTVANDCATIRTGHSAGSRKKVKSGQQQDRVDVRNLGLAIYRYDSNGRPSERLSNVAPIGVVMLHVTYESGVLNAEYYWCMNQSVVNPVGIVRN